MNQDLQRKTVAILVADGFERSELDQSREALEKAGAATKIISPTDGTVRAWGEDGLGSSFHVDTPLDHADADDYDALLLPGGVMSADTLRMIPSAVRFVRSFFEAGKPVAAICHGAQLLIEAGVVRARKLTSYPSLKTDFKNAGADWIDEAVVVDRGLVTGRRPADTAQFNAKMIGEFVGGTNAIAKNAVVAR